MSSVVLASLVQPAGKGKHDGDPLVRDGSEVIPSVTRVFSSGQHLYLYYEVYDPARDAKAKADIHLLTSVSFFQGKAKTYETPLVEAKQLNAQNRHAAVFQLDVPLDPTQAGILYLPGKRGRRRGRKVSVSAGGDAGAAVNLKPFQDRETTRRKSKLPSPAARK